ncbi:MAG: GTP-binding protein [Bacteroidota bacterium]
MKKPVTILTGFLGAGKTTFLNHLLQENEGTRYAIIENEFGEQGIDNELVMRPDETIVELNNGCLCCTLNDNLYDILNDLFEKRAEFDEVIIEATGVADPTGLAQPFVAHPLIKKHFPLTSIICMIDAELVEDQLVETEEALSQISFSDILLINKIDLVSEDYISILEKKLQQLNPLAKIFKGHKNEFPEIEYHSINEKLEELLLKSNTDHGHDHHHHHEHDHKREHGSSELNFPVQKPHTHHHHHHTEDIHSHTFTFNVPFDFQVLYQQLFVYLTFQAVGLYRIKGLVWLENKEHQCILQSVGRRLDFQEKRVWDPAETKQSILVFIGKNLKRQGLEKLLNKCISANYSKTNMIAK